MSRFVLACVTVTALLMPGAGQAAPFTATYTGQIGADFSDPELLAFFPVGTPIAFELTFDDLFLTDPSTINSNPGPHATTGTLTVGAAQMELTSFRAAGAAFDANGLAHATYLFGGTGPDAGDSTFVGLGLSLTPARTLAGPPIVYYESQAGDVLLNWRVRADSTRRFEVVPAVPAPPLAAMLVAGLAAIAARRRRRAA